MDLAAASLTITSSRSQHISFTKPYIDVVSAILVSRPEQEGSDIWSFLNPFDFATKVVIIASLATVSIVFLVLQKLSPYFKSSETTAGEEASPGDDRRNTFWFFYTTFVQQGPDDAPSLSGKIIVGGWYFFALIIIATYTANLAAFLTVKSFAQSVNSIDDLAAQTEIIYGTLKDSSTLEFFKNSPIDVHRRMYTFMTNTEGSMVDTVREGLLRVQNKRNGEYAFISERPVIDYFASHKPCKTQVVGRGFDSHGFGLALPREMPYETNFSLAILKMRESGFIENLSNKWFEKGECASSNDDSSLSDVEKVRITDMVGVMIILVCSIGASIVIAIIERIWWITKERRKKLVSSDVSQSITPF